MAAANERQHREQPRHVSERAEEGVARPEQGARADDGSARKRLLDQPFAASARADVRGRRLGIGADARDEHEASDAGSRRLPRYGLRALLMHRLERHIAFLDIGRDRIDDGVSPRNDGADRGWITHVGGADRHPLKVRRAQGSLRPLGMPDRDAHARALGGEALHQTATEKPGAAEHSDRSHGTPSASRTRSTRGNQGKAELPIEQHGNRPIPR